MKFYARQKKYKYCSYPVFFWKYRAESGRWVHGGSVYWGNRDPEVITSNINGLQRIAEMKDGVERRNLIRTTPWLIRGVEDYSDRHFSKSIYLRMKELKQQAPKLPANLYGMQARKSEQYSRREIICERIGKWRKSAGSTMLDMARSVNGLRRLGRKLEMLTGQVEFSRDDHIKMQSWLPAEASYEYCKLLISIWRNNPKPIKDLNRAIEIFKSVQELFARGSE